MQISFLEKHRLYLFAPGLVAREESATVDIDQDRPLFAVSTGNVDIEPVPFCRPICLILLDSDV